ncbi:4409_t:CDS:2, partial [Acaulospora morrowiae]
MSRLDTRVFLLTFIIIGLLALVANGTTYVVVVTYFLGPNEFTTTITTTDTHIPTLPPGVSIRTYPTSVSIIGDTTEQSSETTTVPNSPPPTSPPVTSPSGTSPVASASNNPPSNKSPSSVSLSPTSSTQTPSSKSST